MGPIFKRSKLQIDDLKTKFARSLVWIFLTECGALHMHSCLPSGQEEIL